MGKNIQIKCVKNVYMRGEKVNGDIAFIQGKTYDAKPTDGSIQYYAIDENNKNHYMSLEWLRENFIITYDENIDSNLPESVMKVLEQEAENLEEVVKDLEKKVSDDENKLANTKHRLKDMRKNLDEVLSVLKG